MENLINEFNIDASNLTNERLLEIYAKVNASSTYSVKDLAPVLNLDPAALRKKIYKLRNELKSLRGELKKFVLEKPVQFEGIVKKKKLSTIESVVKESTEKSLQTVVGDLKDALKTEKQENVTLKKNTELLRKAKKNLLWKSNRLLTTLEMKRKRYNTLRSMHRSAVASSMKRRVKKHTDLKKKEIDLKGTITALKKKLAQSDNSKKKIEKKLAKEQEKFKMCADERNNLLIESGKLDRENESLKIDIAYVESLLQDDGTQTINTMNDTQTSYSNETSGCVLNLLTEGVGVHHVGNVMKNVSEFCGKNISHIPSVATINRMADQRASLSFFHMSEELAEKQDTTIQSDETRKHGQCYEVFSVRDDESKEWVLGLRDMVDKSSETCLSTLKEIIHDISDCTSSEVGQKILGNIKSTMSDRAATEKKFHTLLQNYREEILPQIYSNWDELTESEKETMSQMNNFYCGLHLLVNFAELSAKVVKQFEENGLETENLGAECNPETAKFTKNDESGTIRLVRTACKCLARGADEKSGCYMDFKTFLSEKYPENKLKSAKLLVPFRGNRFNIMFYNAEVVFWLADDISEFFTKVHIPTNRLQKAVLLDIQETKYLAVVKALGLCSKIVTGPFWRALETKDCSLETATEIYQQLYHFLSKAKEDCSDVVCGEYVPFPDIIHEDDIYRRLTQADPFDALTCAVLQQIFQTWTILLSKAASDHLEGGRFETITHSIAKETKSVPTHNKYPERVFALLDALTRFRPAATSICNEGYIMFSLNKTGDWLKSLPDEKKNKYFDMARQQGNEIRGKYRQRLQAMEQTRRETLAKKRKQIEKKEGDQFRQKEQLVNDILYFGLWQYPESVDQNLKSIEGKGEQKKALKTQILFRKSVLEQKGDKKLFQFSEKGQQYTIEKLTENVKCLIKSALSSGPRSDERSIFTGKRIIHHQMEEDKRVPFTGRVISTVPGYPQWYNVIYDAYPDVYVYKLSEDYANGDLEIVVEDLDPDLAEREPQPGTSSDL